MSMLKDLFDCKFGRKIPENFANQNIDYESALRDEIKRIAGTPKMLRRNGAELFDLLEANAEEVLPRKVDALIGTFAEVIQVGNKDILRFRSVRGKQRGKSYVTRATAAGVYETFRLDSEYVELIPHAYGAAGIMDFERYLNGDEDIMDLYNVILEGMLDRIFEEIQKCLIASYNDTGRPAANKVAANNFDGAKMAGLIQTVSAYGAPVIYCGPQFAATMVNVISDAQGNAKLSDQDITDYRDFGYIGKFAGAPVVVIPNSFLDGDNAKLAFNPRFAYVIPAGREKIVKVALVGDTHMKYRENEDWSMEIQYYKKIAVGIVSQPIYWGIYYISGIDAGGWDNTGIGD